MRELARKEFKTVRSLFESMKFISEQTAQCFDIFSPQPTESGPHGYSISV